MRFVYKVMLDATRKEYSQKILYFILYQILAHRLSETISVPHY